MFKIYHLEIKGIEPFSSSKVFVFSPFFTLIRGGNGAGKTTILEALAMLGHCSVMSDRDQRGLKHELDYAKKCYIKYTLVIGNCYFENNTGLADLASKWKSILNNNSYKEITLQIFHKGNMPRNDLKNDLKNEDKLKSEWAIAGNPAEVDLIRQIIAFSRPEQVQSEDSQLSSVILGILKSLVKNVISTPPKANKAIKEAANNIVEEIARVRPVFLQSLRSRHLELDLPLPPIICYFNTDMYHFGLGLDIRESPKHLSEELSRLVKDRLHLVDSSGNICNFFLIQEFWDIIYSGTDKEKLASIKFSGNQMSEAEIRITDQGDRVRNFLSSGENQTLSLGIVFGSLKPSHSIILLDEPDLHLSLPAGLKMYNELFKRSILNSLQVISVSHLPFVFPQALHDEEVTKDIPSYVKYFQSSVDWFSKTKDTIDVKPHNANYSPPCCLSLYHIRKTTKNGQPDIDIKKQKEAAVEAAKYQNHEIDSILSQSKSAPPTKQEIVNSLLGRWIRR